jgi:hypothetical protein
MIPRWVRIRALQLVLVAMLAFTSSCRILVSDQSAQTVKAAQQASVTDDAQVIVHVINEE